MILTKKRLSLRQFYANNDLVMNKHLLTTALVAAALCGAQALMAVPAKPGVMRVGTADGRELNVRLVGDEFFHQYFTEDGYPLMEKDGNFYYCDYNAAGELIASGIKAQDKSMRDASAGQFLSSVDLDGVEGRVRAYAQKFQRRDMVGDLKMDRPAKASDQDEPEGPPFDRGYGLFPDLRFPAYGHQKAIVILVEYQDTKFKLSDPHDYFSRMLNQTGFNDYGGTGCAKEYFELNSGGNFVCDFDVYGPITLSHNMAWYGGNGYGGDDQRPGDMVKEACDQLDDEIDFTEYDRNHDGVVDNVFIFYAGRGEASGGSADTVWPHSWNMASAGYPNLYYDGVRVYTYGCSNEWENGRPDGVGTFIHEFSHVMGLPDLYATRYTSSFTPGAWSALDYGPYNNDGMTPPLYSAFERYALGWMAPREMSDPANAMLPPISENVAGVIRTPKDTEFFLVENRQKTGWDTYIPGHGMLVWHVDYNESVWNRNEVNNTPSHQYVDIEEADGTQSDGSRAGDAFPGTSNKTEFTASTNPAMKTWNGTAIDVPLTDIAENGGNITFKINGGGEVEGTQATAATALHPYGFTANWRKAGNNDHLLTVYTKNGGKNHNVEGYAMLNVGKVSSYKVTDLKPGTTYYYTVSVMDGWNVSGESNEIEVKVPALTIEAYAAVATEASDVTEEGFTANWESLADASDYSLYVYTKKAGDRKSISCDFTDGVKELPEGWSSTSTNSYGMASYCGAAIPSLRMVKSGDNVTTGEYADGVVGLQFWCRGSNTGDKDQVRVYGFCNNKWTEIFSDNIPRIKGGKTITVEDIPAGTTSVRIDFIRTGASGSMALDDIVLTYNGDGKPVYLSGFNGKKVGNVTSCKIDGLKAGTPYYYKVQGIDGNLYSQLSNEISVTTQGGQSGIESVGSEAPAFRIAGRTVYAGDNLVTVYDLTGSTVAEGMGELKLPAAGCYIVTERATGKVVKVMVK